MPFLVAAFLAGADFVAGLPAFAETALVAAGLAAGALAFAFAGAAFTETGLVAFTETGLALAPLVVAALAGAGDLVETFAADAFAVDDLPAFAEVFASDFDLVDFFSTPAPPKAAAQPSV